MCSSTNLPMRREQGEASSFINLPRFTFRYFVSPSCQNTSSSLHCSLYTLLIRTDELHTSHGGLHTTPHLRTTPPTRPFGHHCISIVNSLSRRHHSPGTTVAATEGGEWRVCGSDKSTCNRIRVHGQFGTFGNVDVVECSW